MIHGKDGGSGVPQHLRPGRREAAVFVLMAVASFLAWLTGSPGVLQALLGECPTLPDLDTPIFALSPVSVEGCVLALAGGFAFPRGFYLWGTALALHTPFTEGLTVYLMEQEGIGLVGGTDGIITYVVVTVVLIYFSAFVLTVLSTFGMGLRLLANRWRSR